MKFISITLLFFVFNSVSLFSQVKPLPNAHAHNDYENARPLQNALDNGFTEVEVDIHLIDGELYVAHDRPLFKNPARTLRTLYLEPLARRVRENGGRVYPDYQGFFYLMIDIKTHPDSTYRVLWQQLQAYTAILSRVNHNSDELGKPVKVFLSGDRPDTDKIAQDSIILAGVDGRFSELGKGTSVALMPLVSAHYIDVLKWRGRGKADPAEVKALQTMISKAHAEGKRVRFWGAPDNAKVWDFLLEQQVDMINTDRLVKFKKFMEKYDK